MGCWVFLFFQKNVGIVGNANEFKDCFPQMWEIVGNDPVPGMTNDQ
jgi:hypothetical protein